MTKLDPIVAVAIGVLGAIFVGALVAFVFVLRHKFCKKKDLITDAQETNSADQTLVDRMENDDRLGEVDSDCINIMPPIDKLVQDEDWVGDATGLIPHCLPILKTCHQLTEKLVALTMGNAGQLRSPESLTEIVTIAKRISPRVDDVVRSMYPPLDPRLLEARCTALVLSVTHLVIVTKNACCLSGVMDWIDQSLADIEDHLAILKEASINVEHAIRLSANLHSTNISHVPGSPSHDHQVANGYVLSGSYDQPAASSEAAGGHSSRAQDSTLLQNRVPNGNISVDRDSIQLTENIRACAQPIDPQVNPISSTQSSPSCHKKTVDSYPDIQRAIHKNMVQVPLTVHRSNETSQV